MQHFISVFVIVVIVGLDQVIKVWATQNLAGASSWVLIPGLLQLTYTRNFGAAFSLFWGQRAPLILVTGLLLAGLSAYLLSDKCTDSILRFGLTLIIGGGLGNLIDRIRLGFVVDYLDISQLFNYPIFNFADCMVFIGAFTIAIYVLFIEGRQRRKVKQHEEG